MSIYKIHKGRRIRMEYVLLNKNAPILQFRIERHEEVVNLTSLVRMDICDLTIIDNATLPINMQPTIKGLKNWLLQRKIPNNRAFVENLLDAISDTENPYRYLDVTYGLSLNDTFWVKPAHSTVSWSDINLYDNPFSEIVAGIAFTGKDSHIQGIVTTPEYTTNGMLRKCWHRENNVIYLYKGSTPRYANGGLEALSEVYASQIAAAMGLKHAEYKLTTFHNQLVSACPLFTSEQVGYMPISGLLDEPILRDELMLYDKQHDIASLYGIMPFSNMMVFDALIHNTDRHLNNFGVLIDNESNRILGPAPLFDHGNSLFYNITDDEYSDLNAVKDMSFWGLSFDTLAKLYLHDSHRAMLTPLLGFKFNRIPSDILTDTKLNILESYIQQRASYFIRLLDEKYINFIHPNIPQQ